MALNVPALSTVDIQHTAPVVVHYRVDVVQGGAEPEASLHLPRLLRLAMGTLLLARIELLPTEGIDKHGVLLQILLQCTLFHKEMSIFIIDKYFLILKIVYCFIVYVIDRICVVECIRRCLLPKNTLNIKSKIVVTKFFFTESKI